MKYIIPTILLFVLLLPATAASLGTLEGVLKPSIIDIHGDRLFVMDIEQVHVYSMKDMSLIKSFGKKGEGPGEYKIIPNFPLSLKAFDEFLIVESIDKLSHFTLEGKYIKEKRKLPLLVKISEIGKNYIGRRIIQPQDGSLSTSALKIYDSEFKEVKELYKQKFLQQGAFPNLRLDLGKDFLLYQVADNKIFVEKSDKDFLIDVYDFKGNKLYEIKKDYKKIPITSDDKKNMIKDLEMDPDTQMVLKKYGFKWNEFSRNFKYEFPSHRPPIKSMEIDNNKIYISTFRTENNKVETIVM
ncbi:MAG: 6-bladed beta-propeller, partial [Candidatus Aminicenantes bacterium]|nr:6-bladed beta-propeller [Candidatus Aminicenantes bacterium]